MAESPQAEGATPPARGRVRAFVRRRLVDPILDLLRQGVTPKKIALSLAFGLGIGIFPVLGVSTVLCTVVAIALRLNLPAIQLVNYLASPLQLALIIPFVRVGEHLLGVTAQPLSVSEGFRIMADGVVHAVIVLWSAIVHAALGWVVIGPVLIYALYRGFCPVLERAAQLRRPRLAARTGTTVP
jgi:uncharacterized protein (DUF2062 family)